MRLPFVTPADQRDCLEPPPSPLLPVSCLLAIAVAVAVVAAELGGRLALITAAFAAVMLATRMPRVLPVTAALALMIAGIAVLAGPGSAAVITAHTITRTTTGR
jgi:hypothetical protein